MPKYMTKQRKILLAYLSRYADESLTAHQIADALAEHDISISAVYRNLADLESEHKVRRMTKGGQREIYYQYADAEACRASLHLSCQKCGRTYHMDMIGANILVNSVAQNERFEIDRANAVLYGVCEACQNQ